MMGLLESFTNDLQSGGQLTPAGMGLLSAGLGIIENNRGLTSGLPALGIGGQQGLKVYSEAQQQSADQRLQDAKLQLLQNKAALERRRFDVGNSLVFGNMALPGPSGAPGMPSTSMGGINGVATIGSTPANVTNPLLPSNPMARWPSPMPASRGGPSFNSMTPEQAYGLQVMGFPDVMPALKLAHEGYPQNPGVYYTDPTTGKVTVRPTLDKGQTLDDNGNVINAPGATQSAAAMAGAVADAQEVAKANHDLLPLNYVDRDGRPIGGTRGGYIDSLGGPSTASFPDASPAPQPLSFQGEDLFRQLPQPLQARIIADARQSGNPAAKFSYQYPNGRMVNGAVDFSSPPAVGQSAAGFLPPASAGMPSSRPVLQSEGEKKQMLGEIEGRQATRQKLNDNWVTTSYNPVVDAGRSAQQMLANLDAFKNIDLSTGWGTQAQAGAANLLSSLGVQKAENFVTNVQKFQSIAMDRLLTSLQAQKGPQTEGDSQRAQNTFVQLQNTNDANRFIADFARAKANQDARRAEFYKEALPLAQKDGDLNVVDRQWAHIQGSIWNDPVLQKWRRK